MIPLASLLEVLVLAGHTLDTGRSTPLSEASGDEGDGGIGVGPIVAVVVLALVTVMLLVWLSSPSTRAKLKAFAPLGLFATLITAGLMLWAVTSGDDDEKLFVERWTNDAGTPELIVSLGDNDLNTLATTNGRSAVRVRCVGRQGQLVLDAEQKWPFKNNEPGYDYPHFHQAATREQAQRADRCRLQGTRLRLEADVKGALTG